MITYNYPFVKLVHSQITFYSGNLLELPLEFTKKKNLKIIEDFYENLLKNHCDELVYGTDPLGFDYVIFQKICFVGVLLSISKSHLVSGNKKKYHKHIFDREYFTSRIKEDKKIQNFEEFIPVEIVTQNIHELRNLNSKITQSVDAVINSSVEDDWGAKFEKSDDNIKKIYVGARLTRFLLDNLKFYIPDFLETLKFDSTRQFNIYNSVFKIAKIFSLNFKKSKWKIEIEGNTNRQIVGEKEYFEIILMLLVENAVKYSSDKTISPKIKLKENPNGQVDICISSFGEIIPSNEQSKLFTKGFRASTVKNLKEGSGMGLYNANRIIKLFGGELIYNYVGVGLGWNNFTICCKKTTR